MPAGYTHYVFGEQVLDQLDESIKKRIMPYIDLYHIGIHGPDILFIMMSIKRIQLNH